MKLSICLNSVTRSLSKPEAIHLAKKLGYPAVEFWEGANAPVDEIKQALTETGVSLACMGGSNNLLVDPSTRAQFLDGLSAAIANTKILGTKNLIATTGQALPDISREAQHESIVDGLKEAAKLLEGTGLTLNLEPLNVLVNHKGHYLASSIEAFEIVRKVASPNIKVLFDIYHQQITEGHLIANITANIDLIGHFHVAGNPGRGEPYFGEINYKEVFKAIDATGYKGYAGLEYWPAIDGMEESLTKTLEYYA
ncbi:MAG: TIM barrel protein [Defluviitaleaceae bacterium]|nr:TIM barrel protein [Defluviitaleaceae bacterium]